MKKFLQNNPLFLFLLPVFFVEHGFLENYGFISPGEALLLLPGYIAAAAILFLCLQLFFKNTVKSALLASWILAFYLFFGALHDWLLQHAGFFHKYTVILTLFLLSTVLLAIYLLKTKRSLQTMALFLNILLLIYLSADLGQIFWKWLYPPTDKFNVYPFAANSQYIPCAECPKPDIYFLLFDEYESSSSLRKYHHYDNSSLDSFLTQKDFSLQYGSMSNYNFTPFSMASILNMSYLDGIHFPDVVSADDYNHCATLIRDNKVIEILSQEGYEIVNYSIFDLAGNPSVVDESFLPLKTKLITGRTFYSQFMKDAGWRLYTGRFNIRWLSKYNLFTTLENNNRLIQLVEQESKRKTLQPRFIYAHLYMPHPPFYYNRYGVLKSKTMIGAENQEKPPQAYVDYLPYTNSKVKELINTVRQNTHDSAVIIFMGDHGFRYADQTIEGDFNFRNQHAVYFPDRDYHLLYDSMTSVNTFRIVFDKLFRQQFPLLKDSVIFLRDKK